MPPAKSELTPKLKAPAGSCDTHMHIYDHRFPKAPTAKILAPDASVADYLKMRARLGIERTVVVQPSAYGKDNRCTLEAMAAIGPSARGVAVVDGGGALVGVFTDGDLRRALPTADLAAPMAGHMTRSPVTVDPRLLATEALRLMTERPRPIQLLIACEDGRPVGVVGMHDFLKAGIA